MKKLTFFFLALTVANIFFAQTIAVSTTKANIFYQWIDNPVTIVIENCPCKNIIAKADTGKLEGSGCQYTFTAESGINETTLTIGEKSKNKPKWLYSTTIRVKPLPNPLVMISNAGRAKSIIKKNELLAYPFVNAPVNPFGFEFVNKPEIQRVLTYSLKINRLDSLVYQKRNLLGGDIPEDVCNFIRFNCIAGDKIQFQDIIVLLYGKEKRNVDDLEVTLSE